jgi:pimeloyl-ACP methyl ester carboxylesterase
MQPTLLLIHGFPHAGAAWAPQVEGLAPVARVLAPDLRGFGDDRRPLPPAMAMDAYAEDLRALLDALRVERAVIGGLSMGGYVALAFAARWPERVQGLLLCNTRATADTAEGRAAREQTASDALSKGAAVIARAMAPKLVSERTRREQPQVVSAIEALMARQRPEAIAAAARGMALRPDRTAGLAAITAPALIITGTHDELMPIATSEALLAGIPQARMAVLDGVGHLSNLEAPDRFNDEAAGFLLEL